MPDPLADADGYRMVALYRRTVSAVPSLKKLVPVTDLEDAPMAFGEKLGQLCPDVIFRLLERIDGQRYWAKQWLNDRWRLHAPTAAIEDFLATLGRHDLCLAVEQSAAWGALYPFSRDLFTSNAIVHRPNAAQHFSAEEQRIIESLSAVMVRHSRLPEVELGRLTDFQVARTSRGLVFLDFEPNRFHAAQLANVRIP